MKNNTWKPTRRNRNFGTSKSGYSANNELTIPEKWVDCKIFWERLANPVCCPIEIGDHKITLLVEPPRKGSLHASTPHDLIKVLGLIPMEHLKEIEIVVFRQPTRKEEMLNPVWGRFAYYADLGRFSGSGIYLESVSNNTVIKWGNRITPMQKKELDLLEADGHDIQKVKRGYEIHTSPRSVRTTQLFRTVPHEIGHSVDFLKNSLNPSIDAPTEAESDYIDAAFNSKPSRDKEEYANAYAREFYQRYSESGELPFEQILLKDDLLEMGLKPAWFSEQ